MNHVLTQIPYALTAAYLTAGAFLCYRLTGISWISYLFIVVILAEITVIYRKKMHAGRVKDLRKDSRI